MYKESFRLLILDILDHSLQETNSLRQSLDFIHENYHISHRTILRWLDAYTKTGNVKIAQRPSRDPPVLLEHIHFAEDLLAINSTLTDEELCLEIFDTFDVAYTNRQLGRAIRNDDYTRKVCERISKNRNEELRRLFKTNLRESLDEIPARCYAVIDESHLNAKETLRRYGRSPKGYPAFVTGDVIAPTGHVLVGAAAIAAMSIDGIFAVSVHEEIIDHAIFLHAFEYKILPHLNAFPGDRSVLLLDNASPHMKLDIYNMCEANGVLVVFLPPYSYDFSPIEPIFHLAKDYIRRTYGIMHAYKPLAAQLQEALWSCCSAETACNEFDRVDILVTAEEFAHATSH
jgi:transposase